MILRILSFTILLLLTTISVFGQDITIGDDGIVRCKDVEIGTKQTIFGDEYEVVNRDSLIVRRDQGVDLSKMCVSNVTNMDYLLQNLSTFNDDISNWDVSSVNSMRRLFFRASSFNRDISRWDVSKVTNMSRMFQDATAFNKELDDWDVSSVEIMDWMFVNAQSFNSSIGSWDVSSVTDMSFMFYLAINFNQDLDKWDVSSVKNMSSMFRGAHTFNGEISSWDVSSVERMDQMFDYAYNFDIDISKWDVSSVVDMSYMFLYSRSFNKPLNDWDVSNVSNMTGMFKDAYSFNQNLSKWCVPLISSQPPNFSSNSPLQSNYKPIWGTCPGTPSTPSVLSPSDNSEDLTQYVDFEWTTDDLTTHTHLQVFEGTDPVVVDTLVTDTFFTNTEPFKSNTNYNWRVKGINQSDSLGGEPKMSDWSSIYSFTVLVLPDTITLSSPTDTSTNVLQPLTFVWNQEPNSDSYTLQVSTDDFSTFVINGTTSDTSITTSELDYNTPYSWRVRGSNSLGDGDWSEVWSFTTVDEPLPPSEPLIPFDGQDNVGTLTEFKWESVDSSSSYHLQLSTDSTFSSVIFESKEIESSPYTLTDPIGINSRYFWRIRVLSENEFRHSEWSDTLSFTTGVRTSVEEATLPTSYSLNQNYPNPFNPTTSITYSLPHSAVVSLKIYDITGKYITTLVDGVTSAGIHTVTFDAGSLSSGMYVYTLETDGYRQSRQMMLVK